MKHKVNLMRAIDWQRNNAKTLNKLIQTKQDWYQTNVSQFVDDWYRDVFNVDTANEFGLKVWARILDLPLFFITRDIPVNMSVFGFGSEFANFNRGVFGDKHYSFSLEQRRICVKLKAFIISMNGSSVGINKALKEIFGEGKIHCVDHLDMTMTYVVTDPELYKFIDAVYQFNLLPKPACVDITQVIYKRGDVFGFGSNFNNFDRGNFYDVK